MKISIVLISFFLTGLMFQGCQESAPPPPQIDMDSLRSEIQAIEDQWSKADNENNVDVIMAMYAEDAVTLPANEPMVSGKEAIRARMTDQIAKDSSNTTARYEVIDVFAGGDYVVEVGKSMHTDTAGNVNTGKYMVLFRKIDGGYEVVREIWNADKKTGE
jgi:uncharacterized protein (TIGR02246 family)